MTTTPDGIRQIVRDEYGSRVAAPKTAAGHEGDQQATTPEDAVRKGLVVNFAGYSEAEMADLPQEAVTNSFGCGNPVALSGIGLGDTVLDLGCGAGMDLILSARLVGDEGRVIGVDMTDEMLEKATANIEASGLPNIEVRKGIIEDLPVESASVDWVISNCVLNLSPEKARVFAEIERVLRPGGQMLVSDMMARDLPEEIREIPGAIASCVAGAIDEEAYVNGLLAAGLTDVAVRERLVYTADQLASSAIAQIDSALGGVDMEKLVNRYASELEGRIWSAKVYARKA